ncbi:hypothetical protein JCM10213v2_009085 [Rhodosporidiobolus nylandii]
MEDREAEELQWALLASLADQDERELGRAITVSSTPSTSRKRSRSDEGRSPPSSKRVASPSPSSAGYIDLLQAQLEFEQQQLSTAIPPGAHLEAWQQVAVGMARSRELRAYAPGLAERLEDVAIGADAREHARGGSVPEVERCDDLRDRFLNGALRLTRTPGRADCNTRNCIELSELLRKGSMLGLFSSTFILEHDFLAPLLPIEGSGPHSRRNVPLHISRDLNADPLRNLAAVRAGVTIPKDQRGLTKGDGAKIVEPLFDLYQRIAGPNWLAAYPYAGGCSHSKIMVVRYPDFLLVAITSCNTMEIDMRLSDNHWYIQTFPEYAHPPRRYRPGEYEQLLLHHMNQLDCVESFTDLIAGRYDSPAPRPGVKTGNIASSYGALRLGTLARELIPSHERRKNRVELEICTGSVSTLPLEWVKRMDWVLKGKKVGELMEMIEEGKEDELDAPEWRIIFPTSATVKSCSREVREAASNIGCSIHMKNWSTAPSEIRSMFRDYTSKDPGRLFHQKTIIWLDKRTVPSSPLPSTAPSSGSSSAFSSGASAAPAIPPPHLLYIGSHNLSKNAWGCVELDRRTGEAKLSSTGNFEIGVVVKGEDIEGMLELGSSWEDVVTYERAARRYGEDDHPWNSPAWVREE